MPQTRNRASRTAGYVAFYRALETIERRRAPLFQDRFASAFVPRSLQLALRTARIPILHGLVSRYADRRAPGARTSAIARTRFIDDVVRERAAAGVRQLVILGAGFDCRAHRLPELGDTKVFEVDRAETQAKKKRRIPSSRDKVVYVAVDFERDTVGERLSATGWDPARPTTFIWEGVTNYLAESAVAAVLAWLGQCAPGSTVVFTYIHRGLLDGTVAFDGGTTMMRNVRALGEPWRFGLYPDQVGDFLARFGLTLRENLGADEYRARYLPASQARGYAFYRIAVAERE